MSDSNLRLVHPAGEKPAEGFRRQLIESLDLLEVTPRPTAATASSANESIESLEKRIVELESWGSAVEKWAIDAVERAQADLTAYAATIAQYQQRIQELEQVELEERASRVEQTFGERANLGADLKQRLSLASTLINVNDFSLAAWTAL
jgi:DNA repair exonuclease SbcCD ATPase subunit